MLKLLRCWCCGQVKTADQFRRDARRPSGYRECEECQRLLKQEPELIGSGAKYNAYRDRATGVIYRVRRGEEHAAALRRARRKWRRQCGHCGTGWSNP